MKITRNDSAVCQSPQFPRIMIDSRDSMIIKVSTDYYPIIQDQLHYPTIKFTFQ